MATEAIEDIEFLWRWRKYLLLFAMLVASVTYGAGLNPPGGVRSEDGGNASEDRTDGVGVDPPLPPAVYPFLVGDPLLASTYSRQYTAFFYCNAAAFMSSLVIIMLLLDRRLSQNRVGLTVLRSAMLLDLLALMAAFAAGSCRDIVTSIYVSGLFAVVFAYVALHLCVSTSRTETHLMEQRRRYPLLLATFATPLTYSAGLTPPGGFWSKTVAGHHSGDPLLHDGSYKISYEAFFYANAISFVASLAMAMMAMSRTLSGRLVRSYALPVCILVELLSLMAAYAAGSCRWPTSTVYVFSLGGAVLLYIVLQMVVAMETLKQLPGTVCRILSCADRREEEEEEEEGEAEESVVSYNVELSSLAATVTYQIGLNPPGGFWAESDRDRSVTAGDPVLLDHYVVRYQVFFYCNALGFMASLTVILLLVNQTLSKQGIRSNAFHVCIVVGLLGLMCAYAAGSCRQLRTSIYVLALVAAVVAFLVLQFILFMSADYWSLLPWLPQQLKRLFEPLPVRQLANENKRNVLSLSGKQQHRKLMCFMVLGVLVATVTYQSGLTPPGGTWGDDSGTGSSRSPSAYPLIIAGNPILMDTNPERYQAFFYCNSTSFMASIMVIILVLQHTVMQRGMPLWVMQTAVVLDLLGLLGAYTAGSWRDWETSAYVIGLIAVVVVFITIYAVLSEKNLISWKCLGENHSDDVANV